MEKQNTRAALFLLYHAIHISGQIQISELTDPIREYNQNLYYFAHDAHGAGSLQKGLDWWEWKQQRLQSWVQTSRLNINWY